MDELALNSEVRYLHEIPKIYVAVNGAKEVMFTWGGLTARPKKGNRVSDDALNREKSAEAIVPLDMPRMGMSGRAEHRIQLSER